MGILHKAQKIEARRDVLGIGARKADIVERMPYPTMLKRAPWRKFSSRNSRLVNKPSNSSPFNNRGATL
jgi:hypothetical protein